MKTCSKCGLEKPDDVFRPYTKHGRYYIYRQCMKCRNEVTRARARKKRLSNPSRWRAPNIPSNSRWAPPYYQAWLTELFEAGLPYSEIGHRMSMTKNAIVGRCHRTGLLRKGPMELCDICEPPRKHGLNEPHKFEGDSADYDGPTSQQRLDVLNAAMDNLVPDDRKYFKQLSAPVAVEMPPRPHWTRLILGKST